MVPMPGIDAFPANEPAKLGPHTRPRRSTAPPETFAQRRARGVRYTTISGLDGRHCVAPILRLARRGAQIIDLTAPDLYFGRTDWSFESKIVDLLLAHDPQEYVSFVVDNETA